MIKRFIIFNLLLPSLCFAQHDLPGMGVTVVNDYKPLLADAVKVDVSPKTIPNDTSKFFPSYILQPRLMELPFIPPAIKPIAMTKEIPDATQNNYFKAGFGTQLAPLFSLNLNTGVSDKRDASLYAMHNGGSGALDYQKFSDNLIQTHFKKFFKKNAFTVKAGYSGTVRYFYGYDHNTIMDFTKDGLKQSFQDVNAAIDFSNTKPTSKDWDYDFTTEYYYYWNRTGANEWHLAPGLSLGKTINKIHHGSVIVGADFNQYNEDSVSSLNKIFHINPMYELTQDNWGVKAGFDISPADSMVYFLPKVEAHYNLIGEYVVPFAGINGEINRNNLKTLTSVNPFLNRNQPISYSKIIDFHGGLKGSAGNHFSFLLKVADELVDHLATYNPDSNDVTKYNVELQEDANVLNLHGEIGYKEAERLNITLNADYYSYTLDFGNPAYGLPSEKITLKAEYNIQNKILVSASVYQQGKTLYRLPNMTEDGTLGGFIDGNLGVIYNYKKNFGAYIQFNNVGASAYRQWYRYPTYAFGFSGGLILKF